MNTVSANLPVPIQPPINALQAPIVGGSTIGRALVPGESIINTPQQQPNSQIVFSETPFHPPYPPMDHAFINAHRQLIRSSDSKLPAKVEERLRNGDVYCFVGMMRGGMLL